MMCLGQLFKDIHTAIKNPPKGALDREILHARLRAYWVRIQYISWNILATLLLYTFGDSLLNSYIYKKQYYYTIIFHSLQLLSIIAYFITSFRDPGYIQPMRDAKHIVNIKIKDKSIENEDIYKYLDINIDNDDKVSAYPYDVVNILPDYNKEIRIDPDAASSNFCWRCKFIRPIRSKHCYDCDRCVIKFDHHCPLVGNCVAANNHRYFVLFMSTQAVVVLWTFYISFNSLFQMNLMEYKNFKYEFIKRNAFDWFCRIVFFVALFFAVFVTVGLCGYHIYLGFTNQTTYEMIKPQIVENYIKDEGIRKKKYMKKQLKKDKAEQIEREKDLKNQRNELEQQIKHLLQNDIENKDDIKYDDNISSDDMSSDFSVPEKVLLFHDRQKKGMLKRKETPKRTDISRFTNEYRNYFDEGFIGNMVMFFTGKIYPEWETPLPCVVVTKSKKN